MLQQYVSCTKQSRCVHTSTWPLKGPGEHEKWSSEWLVILGDRLEARIASLRTINTHTPIRSPAST
jgi:hypothetical protein